MKWHIWLRWFDDHLLAHNLENISERRKLAILRSSLGAEGFRICADLCPDPDLSYDETIQRLEQRFAPALSQILARAQFNRRFQQPGEDASQFATALRALAAKCGYREQMVGELIRDRLVAGCKDEKIRERFLQEPDSLTLEDALKLAQTFERAISEMKAVKEETMAVLDRISAPSSQRSDRKACDFKFPKPTSDNPIKCFNCGYRGHKSNSSACPAIGKTCNMCGKTGHFGRVCRSSNTKRDSEVRESELLKNHAKVSEMDGCSNFARINWSEESDVFSIGIIQTASTPLTGTLKRLLCKISINDVELLIDSGAVASILNEATFQKIRPTPQLHKSAINLKSYTEQSIRVIGRTRVSVSYGNFRLPTFDFFVVERGDNLMGRVGATFI